MLFFIEFEIWQIPPKLSLSSVQLYFESPSLAPSLPPYREVGGLQTLTATRPIEPVGESSDPASQVSWPRDSQSHSSRQFGFEMGNIKETLVIEPTHPSNSGAYYCATADDVAKLIVVNQGDFSHLQMLYTCIYSSNSLCASLKDCL